MTNAVQSKQSFAGIPRALLLIIVAVLVIVALYFLLVPRHRVEFTGVESDQGVDSSKNTGQVSVYSSLPVGSIFAVALPVKEEKLYDILPRNVVLCDGKMINETHPRHYMREEVSGIVWNTNAPDLRDKFVMGWSPAMPPFSLGGSNTESHSHRGITGDADTIGPSQGAAFGYHNNIVLPEKRHRHAFVSGLNSDSATAYSNSPAFVALYYVMCVK